MSYSRAGVDAHQVFPIQDVAMTRNSRPLRNTINAFSSRRTAVYSSGRIAFRKSRDRRRVALHNSRSPGLDAGCHKSVVFAFD